MKTLGPMVLRRLSPMEPHEEDMRELLYLRVFDPRGTFWLGTRCLMVEMAFYELSQGN